MAQDEVVSLAVRLPRRIWRALKVHVAMNDHGVGGEVALAIERHLMAVGDATVKRLLQGAAEK